MNSPFIHLFFHFCRSDVEFYEEIEVAVASPYSVSLEPSDPAVVIVGGAGGGGQPHNSRFGSWGSHNPKRSRNISSNDDGFSDSTNSITCMAVGEGAVDPVLEWRVDGGKLNASEFGIRNWQEDREEGQQVTNAGVG